MQLEPPDEFDVSFRLKNGHAFKVQVHTSWAPPMAKRFFILSKLHYFNNSSFYRVLRKDAETNFVAQWGYRGIPEVDAAWISNQESNQTWKPFVSNTRGTVAFGTHSINNTGTDPNCTAPDCAMGWSVELFVNYGDNSRLDASGFCPFGTVSDIDMAVLDGVFAGYGELIEVCEEAATPYCLQDDHGNWLGPSLDRLLSQGNDYLRTQKPLLDAVDVVNSN